MPVAVATSKPRAYAEPLCERLGLAPHLRAIAGPELDAPDEVKSVTVGRALAALGFEAGADVPLVGDRSHDAEAARANGLRCVGVLWGIGDEAELRAAGASPIVASPARLCSTRSGSGELRLGKEARGAGRAVGSRAERPGSVLNNDTQAGRFHRNRPRRPPRSPTRRR